MYDPKYYCDYIEDDDEAYDEFDNEEKILDAVLAFLIFAAIVLTIALLIGFTLP